MLDFDLVDLDEVLNQEVKRNLNRFPADFMFQLTAQLFLNRHFLGKQSRVICEYGKHRFSNGSAYARSLAPQRGLQRRH